MAQSIASRLSQYLAACPQFDWAAHNCTHFAAAWLQLVEGRAPVLPAVGGPVQARHAVNALGADLGAAVCAALARPSLPPARAAVGDLVLIPAPAGGQALGICAGRTVAAITPAGVVHSDMAAAVACWPVRGA